jgi:glycosyltransferase involved in cell wall biosynthesis
MALVDLGYQVDLLTFPVGRNVDIPGVRIIRIPNLFRAKNISIGPSAAKAALDVILLLWAVCLSLRHRYTFIHGVEEGGAIGVIAAFLSRCALIFEKHSDPASYKGKALKNTVLWVYDRVERITARYACSVIATGPGLVDQVRRLAGRERVHHIFDIPSSLVEPTEEGVARVRAELTAGQDRVVMTYVGSFAVYQGVDLMFESMPAVLKRHAEVLFVIIGGSDENIALKKQWLKERGLEGAVQFLGGVEPDRLPAYLAASDVLLSPRLQGVNTPLKLLDYLKSRHAVIATDTEANRLILSSETALIVDANSEAFAEGLCRLAADPELRRRLGEAGRHLIDETYNYEQFKLRLSECYM